MAEHPSPVAGLRLTAQLYKLVLTAWLVSFAVFVPAQLIVMVATGPARANLPDAALPAGDALLIFIELLRPVAAPLAIALGLGCLSLFAWAVLWHAGTVRWWLGAGAAKVRLSEILGHGVVWWWRYFRLAVTSVAATAAPLAALWWSIRGAVRAAGMRTSTTHLGWLLVLGLVVTVVLTALFWAATLRAGWLLGQAGRRSALVAWLRGLGSTLRRPLWSMLPLVVWGLPGMALLVAPLVVDGSAAAPVLAVATLAAAWCWVALYLSYAPREPNEEWIRKMQERAASRVARPAETPLSYNTSRIPTDTTRIPTKPPE